jgi:ATP-dependent Clp endopeptidase proteolytic subunit ClpP
MKFWAFQPSTNADEVDLLVYGYIAEAAVWSEDVGAKEFREALSAHKDVKRINVRINSGGGDAFAGIAIHSMLKAHQAEVVCFVEGLAGSAASLIAMAGDRIVMATGSMIMIHNPSALAVGEASDLRQTADVLDKLRDSLVSIYRARTGKTAEELQTLLDAETWLGAEEAVAEGFADEVAGQPVKAEAKGDAVFFNAVSFPRSAAPVVAEAEPAENAKDPEQTETTEQTPPPAEIAKDPEPVAKPEPPTRETLAAQAPDLLAALLDEGARAERARMRAIDDVAIPGHEAMVHRARYDEPITAEALAVAILRAEREHRKEHLVRVAADAHETEINAAPLAAPSIEDEIERAARLIVGDGRRHR